MRLKFFSLVVLFLNSCGGFDPPVPREWKGIGFEPPLKEPRTHLLAIENPLSSEKDEVCRLETERLKIRFEDLKRKFTKLRWFIPYGWGCKWEAGIISMKLDTFAMEGSPEVSESEYHEVYKEVASWGLESKPFFARVNSIEVKQLLRVRVNGERDQEFPDYRAFTVNNLSELEYLERELRNMAEDYPGFTETYLTENREKNNLEEIKAAFQNPNMDSFYVFFDPTFRISNGANLKTAEIRGFGTTCYNKQCPFKQKTN